MPLNRHQRIAVDHQQHFYQPDHLQQHHHRQPGHSDYLTLLLARAIFAVGGLALFALTLMALLVVAQQIAIALTGAPAAAAAAPVVAFNNRGQQQQFYRLTLRIFLFLLLQTFLLFVSIVNRQRAV
ncbi:hypothetical protein TYRP_022223 [Tyrophagus putrescentiae]|nr:hypothetical protein TYRP_022223 [Tyrophagus putrescentiae]